MDTTEQQYESALRRIEELLPLISDNTPSTDANAVELIEVLSGSMNKNIFL